MIDSYVINIKVKIMRGEGYTVLTLKANDASVSDLIVVNAGFMHPFVNIKRIEVEENKTTVITNTESRIDIEEALEIFQEQIKTDLKTLKEHEAQELNYKSNS